MIIICIMSLHWNPSVCLFQDQHTQEDRRGGAAEDPSPLRHERPDRQGLRHHDWEGRHLPQACLLCYCQALFFFIPSLSSSLFVFLLPCSFLLFPLPSLSPSFSSLFSHLNFLFPFPPYAHSSYFFPYSSASHLSSFAFCSISSSSS